MKDQIPLQKWVFVFCVLVCFVMVGAIMDTAVKNIQGRLVDDIPRRHTILPRTALKNPAVRHFYCSKESNGITLSNFICG